MFPADNLDDDFSDLFGGGLNSEGKADTSISSTVKIARYEDTCKACRGTGVFRSYTGRTVGKCFKCKGEGKRYFKTSLEHRERAQQRAAAKKQDAARANHEKATAWLDANPDEAAWMRSAIERGFEFAASMSQALFKYGYLTERQEASVRNASAKSLERQKQWAAERAEREANKADVDVGKIVVAFAAASASGLKRLKLRLDIFEFSPARKHPGTIYVVSMMDDCYLGKIAEGKFTRSRDCTDELETRIVAACADPHAAAVAYGNRTGSCSCCNRELTNALSIKLGIGPICRSKWGWGEVDEEEEDNG